MDYAMNRRMGGHQRRSGYLVGSPAGNRNGTVGRAVCSHVITPLAVSSPTKIYSNFHILHQLHVQ